MFKKMVLMILWAALGASLSHAQNSPKNELGLLLGGPVTPELAISNQAARITFGSGITFQATYAHRLLDLKAAAVSFEVPFIAAPNIPVSSATNAVPANYASLFITPGLRLKIRPNSTVSPWISVGGGYARFHESAELQDGSPNPGRIGSNRGAAQFGGGVDLHSPIKVFFPIGLRVEIRDLYSGKPSYNLPTGGGFQHNLLFSGGLVLAF
jgi:hypothetical protein